MIQSYRLYGERDPAFMTLAEECQYRTEAEQSAARRSARLESWCEEVQSYLRRAGQRMGFVDDHYSWFERQFDDGVEPGTAAALAIESNLDASFAAARTNEALGGKTG